MACPRVDEIVVAVPAALLQDEGRAASLATRAIRGDDSRRARRRRGAPSGLGGQRLRPGLPVGRDCGDPRCGAAVCQPGADRAHHPRRARPRRRHRRRAGERYGEADALPARTAPLSCAPRCRARRSFWRRRRRRSAATCWRTRMAAAREATRHRRGDARRTRRLRRAHRRRRSGEHQSDDARGSGERQTRGCATSAGGAGVMRIGTGYDLHRLVRGRPLILAGVRIPVRARPRGPLRRRHRVPRGDRRDPRRGRRGRHRPAVSRHRSAVEGRRQRRAAARRDGGRPRVGLRRRQRRRHGRSPSGRSCCRTSTRCARTSPRALGVEATAVSIKGKTNETGRRDRPRRSDGVSRGGAAHKA